MVLAAELSARTHGLPMADVARVRALVGAIGCPVEPPSMEAERWLSLMRVDKKTEGGQLRFVLLPRIGEAVFQGVPDDEARAVLQAVAAAGAA